MRWLLLLGLALQPVQWMVVSLPVLGDQNVSTVALLVLAGFAALRCSRSAFTRVLRLTWPFTVTMLAMLVLWVATDLFHFSGVRDAVVQAQQLVLFVAASAAVLVTLRDRRGLGVLRWAGVAANLVLVAAMSASMVVNEVDPREVFTATVSSGDPNVLQYQLFKVALVGFGYDAESLLSNVRHEMFAGVLLGALVASIATSLRPFRSRVCAGIVRASLGLSAVMVVVSLSRVMILCLLFWPLLSAWRSWQQQRFSAGQLVVAGGALVALAVSTGLGFTGILLTRFTSDTTSYDARGQLLEEALRNIEARPLVGGTSTVGASSHNIVLDSWLRMGVLGALLALALSLVLVLLLATMVARIGAEPPWMVPAAVALFMVVLRMFSAGLGGIPPVEWVALAVVAGAMAARAGLLTDRADAPGTDSVVTPSAAATHELASARR